MRKVIISVSTFVMLILAWTIVQGVDEYIAYVVQYKIMIDGAMLQFANPIVSIDGKTYLPLREVAEILGMNVEWDGEKQEICISNYKKETEETLFAFKSDGEWNSKWGYKDKNGTIIIEPQFSIVNQLFDDEVTVVAIDIQDYKYTIGTPAIWRYGLINKRGEFIMPVEYAYIEEFNEAGVSQVLRTDGTTYFIDKKGNDVDYEGWEETGEGWFTFRVDNPDDSSWGYMDTNGVIKIEAQYDYVSAFDDGFALVGNYIADWKKYPPGSGVVILRFGYINTKGELITPIKYLKMEPFSEGRSLVTEENGYTYYIDRNGNRCEDTPGAKRY